MIDYSRFKTWATRIEPFETDDDWRQARTTMVGASDTAGIMGCGYAGQSAISVWLSKTGQGEQEFDAATIDLMETGKDMEPIIVKRFHRKTGFPVERIERTIFRHEKIDWLGASLDGVLLDPEDGWLPVELKNLTWRMYRDWGDIDEPGWEPPEKYMCQIQHQMAATGTPACYLIALFGGEKVVWRKIARDDDFMDRALFPKLRQFWDCVQLRKLPEVDGQEQTGKLLKTLFGSDDGSEVILPDDAIEVDRELLVLEDQLKTLKGQIDARKNQIRAWIGSATYGRLSVGGGWSWKTIQNPGYTVGPHEKRELRRTK